MGICASCDGTTNKDDGQKELHCNVEEEGEVDKLDQDEEEDSQDALVRQDQQVHHHDQEILHHDQQVHRHDHHYFHQQARGRKSMCRKCNLRLLTLIHVPLKEDTAVHYWLRPIKRGQFRFANFAPHPHFHFLIH